MSKFHHTRRLYPSGRYVDNGVREENLATHLEYNRVNRPGCALLVDGKVVYKGLIRLDVITAMEMRLKNFPMTYHRDTSPYE